jgi:hypothetical protein
MEGDDLSANDQGLEEETIDLSLDTIATLDTAIITLCAPTPSSTHNTLPF